MDGSLGRANPDDLIAAQQFASTWELHCRCPAVTLRCFSILARELSYHSLRHARKNLLSKRCETRKGSIPIIISICFVGFDKAIEGYHSVPPSIGLLACQAPPKSAVHDASLTTTLSLAACSQPKPSLGAPKNWSLAALERRPHPRCGAENMRSCGVSKHLRFPPQKSNLFRSNNGLRDATLSQMWSGRLHALQPFLIVSSAAIGWKHARCEKNHWPVGFKRQSILA